MAVSNPSYLYYHLTSKFTVCTSMASRSLSHTHTHTHTTKVLDQNDSLISDTPHNSLGSILTLNYLPWHPWAGNVRVSPVQQKEIQRDHQESYDQQQENPSPQIRSHWNGILKEIFALLSTVELLVTARNFARLSCQISQSYLPVTTVPTKDIILDDQRSLTITTLPSID